VKQNNLPTFLYFDLGNVLLFFDHRHIVRQMAAVAGVSEALVRRTVLDGDLDVRYDRGDVDCRAFYEEFCARTSTRADYDQLRTAVAEIFEVNESIVPLVRALQAKGQRMGILSNTCAAHWDHCLDGSFPFLNECFEVFALSYQLRALKPDTRIYARAAELASVRAGDIFFVDDRPENVAGALAAGFDAVLFEGTEHLSRALAERGLV
jgi:putative hydrolase of the HAD superfamily